MNKQTIGFDIGNSTVKIVHCSGTKVKKAIFARVPDNTVVDGEITAMDAMADFLRETAKENGIAHAGASVILPFRLVFVRNVRTPVMTPQQLRFNLPFEFRDYLTQDKAKYFFDYSIQEIISDEEGNPKELRMFACAVLKSTISEYRAMFRRAGFRLKRAIPEECAGTEVFSLIPPRLDKPVTDRCLLDIGHKNTNICIYRGNEHVIRRSIEMGIADLDTIIAEKFGVDIHVAESYKLSDYQEILHKPEAQQFYDRLAVEVMKAVNFYNYNNRDSSLDELFLCGGGVEIQPLCRTIERTVHMTVKKVEALLPENVQLEDPALFLKAFGCAMQR